MKSLFVPMNSLNGIMKVGLTVLVVFSGNALAQLERCRPELQQLQLNQDQISSIDFGRVEELQSNPSLLDAANANGETIVQLTPEQERIAVSQYPGLFQAEPPLTAQPQRSIFIRKCQAVQFWNDIELAINKDGVLVQVIQPHGMPVSQWILDERCSSSYDTCSSSQNCGYLFCRRVDRHVNVVAMDFTTGQASYHVIKVYCCVAHTINYWG